MVATHPASALTRQPQEGQAGGDELVELLDLTEIKPANEELAAAFSSTLVSHNLVSHANQAKANDACARTCRAGKKSEAARGALFHPSAAYQVEEMLSPQEMDACWADVVARMPLAFSCARSLRTLVQLDLHGFCASQAARRCSPR